MIDERDVAEFGRSGFIVLRSMFDAAPLRAEVEAALADGFANAVRNTGTAGNQFRYVPMMCERTPLSLGLVDALAEPAACLLGHVVVPVRAKGTRYFGGTGWHRDSDLDIASIGFAAYLEPLDETNGALRVDGGSHRAGTMEAVDGTGHAVATEPGDVIAFDEHLWHSSSGGAERLQWRVDYLADPPAGEEHQGRNYFAAIFQPGWDGGYDVDRYPSYGAHWQSRPRPWTKRLGDLDAYARADAEEAAVRATRNQH